MQPRSIIRSRPPSTTQAVVHGPLDRRSCETLRTNPHAQPSTERYSNELVMGFFSARRSEEFEQHLQEDRKVIRVVRSRFVSSLVSPLNIIVKQAFFQYGKHTGHATNTLPKSPSSPLPRLHNSPTPTFNSKKLPHHTMYESSSILSSPRRSSIISNADNANHAHPSSDPIASVASPFCIYACVKNVFLDFHRTTLAQRLDELSVANAEGLLTCVLFPLFVST